MNDMCFTGAMSGKVGTIHLIMELTHFLRLHSTLNNKLTRLTDQIQG